MLTLLVVIIAVLALLGAPVFAVFFSLALLGFNALPTNVEHTIWTTSRALAGEVFDKLGSGDLADKLATIPLFIFAGALLAESKSAKRLVAFTQPLLGWAPGGLGMVTVLICAVYTTFTGASGVTIVAIGGLLMPELVKQGYDRKAALGLVTGTGSVGLLFPPALPLIMYGVVYAMNAGAVLASQGGESIQLLTFDSSRFYLKAGLLPGALLVGSICAYVAYVSWKRKVPRTKLDLAAAGRGFVRALPELLVPGVVLTVLGLTNEIACAAGFAAAYVLILETLVYRDIKLRDMPKVVAGSMGMAGAIFLVIVSATCLTYYFIQRGLPDEVFAFITSHIHSKYWFLLALNGFLLVIGFMMEIFSAIIVVVPLLIPAAIHYHIDPYHLGVIFLLNLEIGYLHPPVGLNLLISSYRFREPLGRTVVATLPFLLITMAVLLAVTYIPALVPIKDVVADEAKKPETAAGGAAVADAGPIVWPDGAVWTPSRCDSAEMKDDVLAQTECKNMFANYAKCEKKETELDRLSCKQDVLAGGTGEEEEEEEADAAPEADAGPSFDAAAAK